MQRHPLLGSVIIITIVFASASFAQLTLASTTIGTDIVTAGNLTVSSNVGIGTTTLVTQLTLAAPTPNTYVRDLYFGHDTYGSFMSNTSDVTNNPEEYIYFYKSTTGLVDGTITYVGNDTQSFILGLRDGLDGSNVDDGGTDSHILTLSHDVSVDQGGVTIRSGRALSNGSLTANGPYNVIKIVPTINMTSGTQTIRGIYYNPTLTATVGLTHIAYQNTSGNVLLNTTSGVTGIGTTTPSQALDVNGNINLEGVANGIIMHDHATASCYLVFINNGAFATSSHACQ